MVHRFSRSYVLYLALQQDNIRRYTCRIRRHPSCRPESTRSR
jgi:hypothetical protein